LLIETPQYIIFAIFNFCFCPIIYFFLVETKKRSLEELDVIFAAGGNPVKQGQMTGHKISIAEAREVLGLDVDPTHISFGNWRDESMSILHGGPLGCLALANQRRVQI
jgi:hypothetical protein